VTFSPLFLVLFIFFNFYRKRVFQRPKPDLVRNMRFLQLFMGQFSDLVATAYEIIENHLYWQAPDKTLLVLKEAVKLPLVLGLGMYYFPLRYAIVAGLWGASLSFSPFFNTLGRIIADKAIETF
jgi:hypothetical protein